MRSNLLVQVALGMLLLSGCRTYTYNSPNSVVVPSSNYLQHPPQYTPAELMQAFTPLIPMGQQPKPAFIARGTQGEAKPLVRITNATCKVYSLSDLGDDAKLCKWIAATIPQMIEPTTWSGTDAKLTYYAPAKVLVIHHSPAVHARVDEFLQSLKKARPQSSIAQAQFDAPTATQPSRLAGPKHLFNFVIRYEGDGAVDANVAEFIKTNAPNVMPINSYSSDPLVRMEQLMIDSENLRQMHDEWRRFWMNDQPSQWTPSRVPGGVSPASQSINGPADPLIFAR